MRCWHSFRLVAVLLLALATPAAATVPGQVDFQGLLLDGGGQPANGTVDLVFTLFDAPAGGTSVWTESLTAVPLVDGVYSVTLGATTPITPALLAGGSLHLEIQADGETLSPRQPLLAVPYAIRAESAADADQVQGTSGAFLTQIVEHVSFDGGDPPNFDPSEGVADVDGDGRANFIDEDNDGDGLSDVDELGAGSDINLITPVISGVDPIEVFINTASPVVVSGSGFEAGMAVTFGGVPVTPSSVTSTSFDATVTSAVGGTQDLVVTRTNGEQDTTSVLVVDFKRVIVTAPVAADFGGLAAADALCSARAVELGVLGPTFLAWVGSGGIHPADRFTQAGPYQLLDETRIADSWADLTSGALDAPILPTGGLAWTDVGADGGSAGLPQNCQDWTSNQSSELGRIGNANATTSAWTQAGIAACDQTAVLYCFEQ